MSHTHENRADIAARSNRHSDFVFAFRIQNRYRRTSLSAKHVQLTSAVKQLFRHTDRRNIQHHPHVGGQPAAPWMRDPVPVPENYVRRSLEFSERRRYRRAGLEGSQT